MSSVAFGAVNLETIRKQNIETGFLSYSQLENIQKYDIVSQPAKTVDIVDWDELNEIENGSITECSKVSTSSESWKFLQKYKRSETALLLVSRYNAPYPCRYIANHLRDHQFGMASLEDIPLAIAQKFESPYPVFFREANFYKDWFHDPAKSINYLKHEEAHLIQATHNPYLERYMWKEGKIGLTDFGKFIEGCTDFHFRTSGPGYYFHREAYRELLEQAIEQNQKTQIDRACSGDYDAYLELTN